jgi:flagellar basal-body rod modification protein FlgD
MLTTSVATGSAVSPSQVDSSSGKAATLDYDAFLNLLIAQLKNQDPTKPMDSGQYLGQLASFSAVEQGVKTNAKLDAILAQLTLFNPAEVLGRTIGDGQIEGTLDAVRFTSASPAAIMAGRREVAVGAGLVVKHP